MGPVVTGCHLPLDISRDVLLSVQFYPQHCPHRERPAGHAVDEESRVRRVLRQPGEVFGGELAGVFAHLLGETLGVVGADLDGNDRVDVAEDCVRGLVIQLGQILVGDDLGEAVLAGLAEDAFAAAGDRTNAETL